MPLTADKFISNLNKLNGPSKNNKFDIEIVIPEAIKNLYSEFKGSTGVDIDDNYIKVLCESITTPYKSIATSEHRIYGYTEFRPHSLNYNTTVNMNFILDSTHYVKKLIDAWIDYIIPSNGRSSTFNLNYYENYVTDIKIIPLNEELKEISTTTITGAFPVVSSDINYSHKDNNITTFNVRFNYEKWTIEYK